MSLITSDLEQAVEKTPGIGDVGTKVSLAIHNAVLAGGEPTRNLVDTLHGNWLGHPLHPVLTDITIGGWVLGGVFDALGAVSNDDTLRKMGDHLATAGTVAAVPTLLTGLADFSTFPEWSATPATIHGAANIVNVVLYGFSIRERRRGNRRRGVALSALALGLSCFSAWLGGMLVYKHQLGVDHRDYFKGPRRWTGVLDASKLPERKPTRVEIEGKPVMLYRDDDQVYALGATCSHAGGPLNEGKVADGCVQCPWHDSLFDMSSGEVVHGPATFPQQAFQARIHNGRIEVRIAKIRVPKRE